MELVCGHVLILIIKNQRFFLKFNFFFQESLSSVFINNY